MARIRTIKPEFFRHEGLYELERECALPIRVAFAGLWTAADREGRFRWAPRTLKLDCLPFDECDFSRVLDALATRGFIVKYSCDGVDYGFIPSWNKNQVINNRESESDLPDPQKCSIESITSTREARVNNASPTPLVHAQVEGKGKEGEGKGKEGEAPRKRSAPSVQKPMATVQQLEEAGIPAEVAAEFIAHKSGMKAPLTERAWHDHLAEAKKAGWSPLQAAEKVMAKSWRGFEARYVASEPAPGKQAFTSYAQQAADVARTTVPSRPDRDPVLVQIEADAAKAAPIPDAVRALANRLKVVA